MPPILSVIIPTLDEELAIADTLNAVAAQLDHPWSVEILVVDGGSSDATTNIALESGATVLKSAPGRGQQLNAGAAAATGEVLLFLHADVILPSDAFSLIADTLHAASTQSASLRPDFTAAAEATEANAAASTIAAGYFQVIHRCSESAGPLTRRFIRLADRRSRTRALPYGDQALFCSREVHDLVGGFPPRPLMEDIGFARALKAHGKIVRIDRAVTTSARRFEQSPIRTTLCWWTFPVLGRLGLSPRLLAWIYRGAKQPR